MSHPLWHYGLWARQAPLSVGFSRQEYWSGLLCPPPGDLSNPGIKPVFLLSCIAGGFFTHWASWETPKERKPVCAAKSLQLCLTLCNPIDGSPPGFPIPGIHQARTLEWVAISFSNTWKWKGKVKLLSRVWLLATPWTAAYQAPPSMGFSHWSGVPLPSPPVMLSAAKELSPSAL